MLTSKEKSDTRRLPMMPIRDARRLSVHDDAVRGGPRIERARLEDAMAGDKKIFLATQHDASTDEPSLTRSFSVSYVVNIVQSLKLPDQEYRGSGGRGRARQSRFGYRRRGLLPLRSPCTPSTLKSRPGPQLEQQLTTRVTSLFEQYVKLSQNLNYEIRWSRPSALTTPASSPTR